MLDLLQRPFYPSWFRVFVALDNSILPRMDFEAPAADHAAEALQELKHKLRRLPKGTQYPWRGPPSPRQVAARYVREHFVAGSLPLEQSTELRASHSHRIEMEIVRHLAFIAEAVTESAGQRCYDGWRLVLEELDVPSGGR